MSRTVQSKMLRCSVRDGMFSDEMTVVVKSVDGSQHAFFVPRTTVKSDKVEVQVRRVGQKVFATLPTNESGSVVTVRDEDIE